MFAIRSGTSQFRKKHQIIRRQTDFVLRANPLNILCRIAITVAAVLAYQNGLPVFSRPVRLRFSCFRKVRMREISWLPIEAIGSFALNNGLPVAGFGHRQSIHRAMEVSDWRIARYVRRLLRSGELCEAEIVS